LYHHGQDISSLPNAGSGDASAASQVMDNGAKKGGAVATFETLKKSPGLEDLWQLHYAVDAGDHIRPNRHRQPGNGRHSYDWSSDEGTPNYIKVTGAGGRQFHRHEHTQWKP